MVINTVRLPFFLSDLGADLESATEYGGTDFEIGDYASTLILRVEENFMPSLSAFLFFLVTKESLKKLSCPVLSAIDYWITLISLATVQNWQKDTHLDCSSWIKKREF